MAACLPAHPYTVKSQTIRRKRRYLCLAIMKSEYKPTQTIHVQSHDWAAENQHLRKELLSRAKRIEELEAMASSLNKQLSEKIDQINDMMQKMISLMTTNGDATFLESLRQSVVAEIRAEFEAREQKLKDAYANEREKLTSDSNARLAVYQGELDRLKEKDGEDDPAATIPSTSKWKDVAELLWDNFKAINVSSLNILVL